MAYLDDAAIQQIVAAEPARETLRASALADEGSFWVVSSRVRAIRAVATFDPATAFLAAQKTLETPQAHDRTQYPYLLVELDELRATRVLVRQCVRERSTAVRHAIGRALSRVDMGPDAAALLDAAQPEERSAGCVLCAFRELDEAVRPKLRELLQDVDQNVADAALWALRHIRRAAHTEQLTAAAMAPGALRVWRWALLDALLAVADLGDEGDGLPKWLRRLDATLPADIWHYAIDELKKRRKKQFDEMKRQDERQR